ncbi:MAG: 23S rRNA (uracil(1939)-C(5))-methyltransferase RlmD [Chitinophagales bacterium]|nr:23S rRNA (uracil(1939)-C(5))-methyltransferase RlmD [Chitinophagales bacterium]
MSIKNSYRELTGLSIIDIDPQGRGVAFHNGRKVLVENSLPGEQVDVKIVKKDKGVLIGRPYHFEKQSSARVNAPCIHFGICGGCKWQNISYTMQLECKSRFVSEAFKSLVGIPLPEQQPIIAAENTYYYRNKMEFSFGNKRWLTADEIPHRDNIASMNGLGLHPPGAFDKVLDIKECLLQPEPSNSIRLSMKQFAEEQGYEFFDLRDQVGFLRNLTIRTSSTGEVLVIVSFFREETKERVKVLEFLKSKFPQISSLHYVINSSKNDIITNETVVHYHGAAFITERMGDTVFKIGPKSFYQTNSVQAKKLYDTALELAALKGDEVVYDLYTGIGSIALYAAKHCQKVIGIEYVPEAIADAWENARLNGIENAEFMAGDMKDLLTPEFFLNRPRPDLIITDPPRAGMHPSVTQTLLAIAAPRIVYVSCNPLTQARDLKALCSKYQVKAIQPVDMFPQTYHVENVVLLQLK